MLGTAILGATPPTLMILLGCMICKRNASRGIAGCMSRLWFLRGWLEGALRRMVAGTLWRSSRYTDRSRTGHAHPVDRFRPRGATPSTARPTHLGQQPTPRLARRVIQEMRQPELQMRRAECPRIWLAMVPDHQGSGKDPQPHHSHSRAGGDALKFPSASTCAGWWPTR